MEVCKVFMAKLWMYIRLYGPATEVYKVLMAKLFLRFSILWLSILGFGDLGFSA